MNSVASQKSLVALALVVASYLLASRIVQIEAPMSTAQSLVGLAVLVTLPLVAIVLAILDLREIRASRKAASAGRRGDARRNYGLPLVALVLGLAFAGAFHLRVLARFLGRTKEVAALPASASRWTQFTSPTGDFTAIFPEAPTERNETVTRPDGPIALRSVVAATGPGDGYSVMSAEVPKGTEESTATKLERAEADFVKRSNGKLLSRAEVFAGSVPGREVRIDSTERALRVRLFVTGQRIYQVLVVHPVATGEQEADRRFLDSFTLHEP